MLRCLKHISATFHDLRESDHTRNGMALSTDLDVAELFHSLSKCEPFMFELKHVGGYTLTVGYGGELGFAQYAATDGEPPYLVTVAQHSGDGEPVTTFLVGNELTEIPLRFCLPIALIENTAAEFVKTGARSSKVKWEEI